MNVLHTALPGVVVIEPDLHCDERGSFMEAWHRDRYGELGLPAFVQENLSRSHRGVLRGLHFQHPFGQGKLVYVLEGEVFDVAVDVRPESPTFRSWVGLTLSAGNRRQMYIPPGFAHGFCVTGDSALFVYHCTEFYRPETEVTVRWNDAALAIDWPVARPLLSPRDRSAPLLADIAEARLPIFRDTTARHG